MDRTGSQWLKFTKVAICDSAGNELHQVMSGQDVLIRLYYKSDREFRNASVFASFNVRNSQGYLLANLNSVDSGQSMLDVYLEGYFECQWPKFNLRSGSYDCNLFCSVKGEIVDWMQNAFIINVEDGDYYNTGKLIDRTAGEILITHSWTSGKK
jgi:lipopolysaccharide transport system ATP-binding protein